MKNLDVYEKMVATLPEVDRKGKANPYTSLNGHMFSFLDKEGYISIRLSKEDKAKFEEKYNSKPSIQYNSVMRGYVLVPKKLYKDATLLAETFQKSFNYISTLEPKPTKKKKK